MTILGPIIGAAIKRREQIWRVATASGATHLATPLTDRWFDLPDARAHRTTGIGVDGTSHAVLLSTGAHLVIGLACALGPDPIGQIQEADIEAMPARFDDVAASSARDLLMRSLETEVAVKAMARAVALGVPSDTIVWIDGSLHADLAHMAGGPTNVRWGDGIERAGSLMTRTRELFITAASTGTWVIGIAKTQRASVLAAALQAEMGVTGEVHVANGRLTARSGDRSGNDEADIPRPGDGEVLASMGAGWSWPLMLDASQFPVTTPLAPELLRDCPAIVSCYLRPHEADLPLRIDVPANQLGLDNQLFGPNGHSLPDRLARWVPDPAVMLPVIETVMASYGGSTAHNGPLFAVDRLVRLPRRDLETRIMPIIANVAGIAGGVLGVDRGRRRFIQG
ncbi:MAG: DNA double-strand break repair nuclease NurA [Chloroflexi bacterium]|nr:DNA double-strand break repair nuclease NurA [Chloroflexota bacterium]